MKKYIVLASAALLALAACTKVQEAALQQEISFQVANYVQTKADAQASPVKFSNADFGTYAWHHAGETTTAFMVNEKVGLKGTEWTTLDRSYFWPKTGSINFVSYSPYVEKGGPAVTEKSIAYSAYTVSDEDLMYANRAQEQSLNTTPGTYNAVSGANGVPTLFHHALAKLSFKVKVNFTEQTDTVENPEATAGNANNTAESKTTWEVTLYNVTLKGHYETGDLTLDLERDGTSWGTSGWQPNTQKVAKDVVLYDNKEGVVLTTTPMDLFDGKSFFVLPQALVANAQQLSVKIHIKTTQPNKDEQGNNIVQNEDLVKEVNLSEFSSLKSWGMNQNIIYTIGIKPTATVDPNNPDTASDVKITFDPALMDWEVVDTEAVIQL